MTTQRSRLASLSPILLIALLSACGGNEPAAPSSEGAAPPAPASGATPTTLEPAGASVVLAPAGSGRERNRDIDPSEWSRLDQAIAGQDPKAIADAVIPLCQSGDGPCAEVGARLASSTFRGEGLWAMFGALRAAGPLPLHGLFEGLAPLWIDGAAPDERDRFVRFANAAGALRRIGPTPRGGRVLLLPARPVDGRPFWVIVEVPAPCPKIQSRDEGPDAAGQWRVHFEAQCGSEPTASPRPKAPRRHLHVRRFDALPDAGLSLRLGDDQEPTVEIKRAP